MGEYLSGRVLPPTDRFDVLIRILGATPAEQGALATARDRIEEARRRPASGAAVPRQLPFDAAGFAGRTQEIEKLDRVLAAGGGRAVISAVAGTAGVGKTALAVRWAHRVAERFPDGQLYVDLRGYGPEPPVPPADALAAFLRSLGVDGIHIPSDVEERAARYRTEVAGRRLLVVLDNASDADQVRPLLPGTPHCFVLVTSRDMLSGLVARDGAHRVDLDVLPMPEAVSLLRSLIVSPVDDATLPALAEICARLPLALRIAAEIINVHPALSLAELRASALDLLDAGDPRTAVRSVFSWSYRLLSPMAARTFRLLGLHPGSTIDVYATAAVCACDVATARSSLDELVRAHLIAVAAPGAYAFHDLLRAYARSLAASEAGVRDRLFDFYAATAHAAARTLYPHDDLPPMEGGLPFDDAAEALRWLDSERANLLSVALAGSARHTVLLSRALWRYFEVGGHYQQALTVHTAAVAAAPHDGHVLANLGGIHWWLGDHRSAADLLTSAYRMSSDPSGAARAAARLGLVHERLGRYPEAVAMMRSALDSYRALGDQHGEARQLINLGTIHRRLGEYATAIALCRQACKLFAELGEHRLLGYAHGNLGAALFVAGSPSAALTHLEKALALCREAGDRGGEGSAIATIGSVHVGLGSPSAALDHLDRALTISREIGDRSLETETLNTLGAAHAAYGDCGSGLAAYRAALAITERTGDLYEQARALDGIASALDPDPAAADYRTRSLAIQEQLGIMMRSVNR